MVKNYIYSEKIKNSTHIGKWGMLHREYLKKKYPLALTKMIQNGELSAICAEQRPLVRLPAATRRSTTATFIKGFR